MIKKYIDLRSDTLTVPNDAMRKIMAKTSLKFDHSLDQDPYVLELEEFGASLFGKDKAIFLPTGTMSNQIAIKTHTNPGDELITFPSYHINFFESAQTAAFSMVNFNLIRENGKNRLGLIDVNDIENAIESKFRASPYAKPKLLTLENTINSGAGSYFSSFELTKIFQYAASKNIKVHLDGARILNAKVASNDDLLSYGKSCDSLSLCFAKGLGAPFGSLLMGDHDFIQKAKIYQKWFGGCLHQIGGLANAALFSLKDNYQEKLKLDHEKTKFLFDTLITCYPVEKIDYGKTNIIFIDLKGMDKTQKEVIAELKEEGILVFPWNDGKIRVVFHQDIIVSDLKIVGEIFKNVFGKIQKQQDIQNILHLEKDILAI